VCLIEFEMEDLVRKTICDHLFHKECLEQWLKKHENCPICRKNLSKKDLEDFKAGLDKKTEENKNNENEIINEGNEE
jgi:hypothetical protein